MCWSWLLLSPQGSSLQVRLSTLTMRQVRERDLQLMEVFSQWWSMLRLYAEPQEVNCSGDISGKSLCRGSWGDAWAPSKGGRPGSALGGACPAAEVQGKTKQAQSYHLLCRPLSKRSGFIQRTVSRAAFPGWPCCWWKGCRNRDSSKGILHVQVDLFRL